MLIEAEKLCLQLKEVKNLPDDVKEILTGKPVEKHNTEKRNFPGKPVLVHDSEDGQSSCKKTGTENGIEISKASMSGNASDDEIEILNKVSVKKDSHNEESVEQDGQQDGGNEMFVSAVQTQTSPDEELIVLSGSDKAVF